MFHGQSCVHLGNRYGIDRKLLSKWVNVYAKNTSVSSGFGRPRLFSETDLISMKRDLNSEVYNVK